MYLCRKCLIHLSISAIMETWITPNHSTHTSFIFHLYPCSQRKKINCFLIDALKWDTLRPCSLKGIHCRRSKSEFWKKIPVWVVYNPNLLLERGWSRLHKISFLPPVVLEPSWLKGCMLYHLKVLKNLFSVKSTAAIFRYVMLGQNPFYAVLTN